ncbi:tRNA lysidine(34) synthetase TilS [Aeromicrobium sp. 636]|uniref:tRNA(Ile)-lysidine synthase n=1 Tax=Aeromicrobium senzhongii TaxID=2663859 RepID=A0A8I0EVE4_9ACTN|nr:MULTISPECIES: tRNA lysidine(34) synthetase TilS [Aeromicrobium]MBC9226061.1 tRNA lysidine(34) synthetase TilS [Aeromicrobium senzhongii]MCQ3998168.1 tRNA lysidine(34) synthetase TilS [Aeromicrobium sp. 636]
MSRLDPLVARARNLVEPYLAPGAIVAVSGGADSLALAAAVSFFVRRRGFEARAVVVDHGLQAGSAEVAARAVEQCERLGLPASVRAIEVRDLGTGPEDAARSARYRALLDEAGDDTPILLAHTLDDQAETVLLGLGRGSGPRAIQGMRPTNGQLCRPFLSLRRAETERICVLHDLDWWDDPHNEDPAFRRVRVRRELLPLMEDVLGGGVAEALARTADLVRMDADAVDGLAIRAMPESGEVEDLWTFADLDTPVRLRIWRRLAIDAGASPGELSHAHTVALDALMQSAGGKRIELPGGVTAVRNGDRVHFVPRDL